MAATTKLAKFTVTEAGDDFGLRIEDESGRVMDLVATRDQVDLIADTLDDFLSRDDSADEVDEDEDDDVEDDAIDEDEDDEDDLDDDDEAGEDEVDGKTRRV